jgi:hypothetical protein
MAGPGGTLSGVSQAAGWSEVVEQERVPRESAIQGVIGGLITVGGQPGGAECLQRGPGE